MKRFVLSLVAAGSALALVAGARAAEAPAGSAAPMVPGNPPAANQSAPQALTGPQVGSPAPDFSLKTIDGRTVTLQSFRGKTLVINVWATWCPPCREEMPDLIASYPKLAAKNVQFLGVDTTEEAPTVRAYALAKNVPYPLGVDADKAFETAYDVQYFPTTYVVDPQGILRARYIDIIAPSQLVEITAAAAEGRSITLTSPQQDKIDALLTEGTPTFTGNAAAIVADAKKADEIIAKADELLDASDPASGNPTDLLKTRSEQAALRDRAIAALAPVAKSDADKELLARMRGDAASVREQWSDARDQYQSAVALDPKDDDALSGLAYAAGRLKQYDLAIDADLKLAALDPADAGPLIDLGLAYGAMKRFDDAYAAFAKATALGEAAVAAKPGDAHALRVLASAYLWSGRTHARGGDTAGARAQFELALATAAKLPADNSRHDMDLEEAQEGVLALDLTSSSKTTLSLAPWTGAELPGSVPNTIKYRLVVAGAAGKSVALHAADVPKGWVASFCTDRVCAPFKVSVAIPASGVKIIEFQLVPPVANAAPGKVRVIGTDGAATSSATT
jgi:peroxiredoxin